MFNIKNHIPRVVNKLTDIVVKNGKGCWVTDITGKKYLDMTSGIGALSTGHSHPRIINAIKEQSEQIIHAQQNCFVSHNPQIDLTKKLLEIMPKNLDTFFYVNSGSEATDNAIKIARHYTKKSNIISMHRGFHGRTIGAMSITSSKVSYRQGCQPLMPGVFFCNDYLKQDIEQIFSYQSSPDETAAIIIEPILGEGGVVPIPPTFTKYLKNICQENNIMLIVDEVQTGAGRTGEWWNIDKHDVEPDIMTFAKGIASGFPFGGVAASNEIMNSVTPNLLGGTYGGNALGSAVALETIKIIEDEDLLENAKNMGSYMNTELINLKNVNKIRQFGLMIGIDLCNKTDSNIKIILNKLIDEGIIVLLAGDNTIRLMPPLNIRKSEVNYFLDKFDTCIN
jgi:4-aminobutyrate aminotransferase